MTTKPTVKAYISAGAREYLDALPRMKISEFVNAAIEEKINGSSDQAEGMLRMATALEAIAGALQNGGAFTVAAPRPVVEDADAVNKLLVML